MIEEKKLIEKIDLYIKSYSQPPYGREVEGTVELLEEIKDVLNKQSTQGEWIPCSEKLPSDPCWDWRGIDAPCPKVEITTVDRERYIGYFMGGCWYDINGNCIDVVAWKEPSEPWEGE